MAEFSDETMSLNPSEDDFTPQTPKQRKSSPNKVVKRSQATTPSPGRVLKNSPMPKCKSEIQAYDQILLDARAANPPIPWKDIAIMYEKAGGITTGMTNLKNHRFAALKEVATEASAEDIEIMVAAQAVVDAEWEKEKWARIAVKIREMNEPDWDPKFVKKTAMNRRKGVPQGLA
ncbi:hypothetical protein GLAREA_09350 [Glarea lozoyensis ATCC 20868]|uniref:Uncharacterized protein n=2 Tax=Glarea lozoyensis TaxID=101852 RepID=S3CRD6_GLAL2|nr:uncharacterized protein GLAREA_09350 [Glarea lozoyensis ATCC 20868]EHL03261.1 hypothetical protein M7I_0476 [Glarea lozoyensis 74030]EPE28230.1 hypothetical protein GLAREA_09350 [Glarea lozoyensis ATCC 20868]